MDELEITLNGNTIRGLPAVFILCAPFIACFLLGVMIGTGL